MQGPQGRVFSAQYVRRKTRIHPYGKEEKVGRGVEQDMVLSRWKPDQIASNSLDDTAPDPKSGTARSDEIELRLDVEVSRSAPPVDRSVFPYIGPRRLACRQKALMDGTSPGAHGVVSISVGAIERQIMALTFCPQPPGARPLAHERNDASRVPLFSQKMRTLCRKQQIIKKTHSFVRRVFFG